MLTDLAIVIFVMGIVYTANLAFAPRGPEGTTWGQLAAMAGLVVILIAGADYYLNYRDAMDSIAMLERLAAR
jgi:hypothetical protein